jgi:hypothetical protein
MTAIAVAATASTHIMIRSTSMQALYEELARAHSSARLQEAAQARRVRRLLVARRAQRRAERAASRARAAMARASQG